MSEVLTASADAWRAQDLRTVTEWAEEHVNIPNSARARRFDSTAAPWLREPLEWFADPRVKEQVLIFPTGAGKTTFFDVTIPHAIAEAPGHVLLAMQTDPDAKEHMEDRLLPILRECGPVAELLKSAGQYGIRKDAVVLPHMSVYVGGANKSNFQRKSVRYVFLDEAWLIKHGLINEARARLHNRWNGRVVIVSQGGDQSVTLKTEKIETELFSAFERTDKRKYSMVCPECGHIQAWTMKDIAYADSEDDREVIESATYLCRGECGTRFEDRDAIRRRLSTESVYVATNPKHLPFHHGWTAPAPAMFHERWGDLALGWRKANKAMRAGDFEPFKIFITKRLAEFYAEPENNPDVALGASGYTIADYMTGESIDDEAILPIGGRARFAMVDRQEVGFWMAVRAFRADGSNRLLFFNFITTIEECREVQKRYGVIDAFTAEDASHMPDEVYIDCAKYGWTPMFGDKRSEFLHDRKGQKPERKCYSPLLKARASNGQIVRYIRWSNERVKDILFRHVAGMGPKFEVPDDIEQVELPGELKVQTYHRQLTSEVKRDVIDKVTKSVTKRWVKTRRHNHAIDLEGMAKVFAIIKGVAGVAGTIPEDEPPEDQKEPESVGQGEARLG